MQDNKLQEKTPRAAFVRAALGCVLVLCACCFLFVMWQSFLDTCWLTETEHTTFHRDSLLWNTALLCLWAAVLWGATRLIHRLHLARFALPAALLCTALLGTAWIWGTNAWVAREPLLCSTAAQNAAAGNWYMFGQGQYMDIFPFQSGFVAYLEGIYAIFGQGNMAAVSYLNLGFVLLSQAALTLLAGRISPYPQAKTLTALLCASTGPWILYILFNYGNLPSLALVLWACLALLRFLERSTAARFAVMAALLTAAMLLKGTALIPLIAFCIVLALTALQRKSWRLLVSIAALCVVVAAGPAAVQKSYEIRSGQPMDSDTPKLVWLSMGLEESDMAMGWFNGKTYSAMAQAGLDAELCAAQQKADIAARLKLFAHDPAYARSFFMQKLNSQWINPTFGCLHASGITDPEMVARWPALQSYFQSRTYDSLVIRLTGAAQTLVYAAAAIGMLCLARRGRADHTCLALIALGGFLYLMLSEAKAQYAFSYYLMLLPYAAHGCCAAWHAALCGARGLRAKLQR
ncbi:MAG: glycosyltransferase family 39 protein [Ruthenibacterium sp.]